MIHYKNPTRVYQNTPCVECIPGVYLFGILNDGVGHRKLKLKIYFNKQTGVLYPISVYKVK